MRIAIATLKVPFLEGGSDAHAEGLRVALLARGHPVDVVTMPFRFFPPEEVTRAMRVWAEEDFMRLNMYEPDMVVCLKFPTYALRHPNKVTWLQHQHRSAYELFDAAKATPGEVALRDEVHAFDVRELAAIPRRYTISRRVAERLERYNGIEATTLYQPPPFADEYHAGRAQPYIFFPSRIETAKRQVLLVRAMAELRGPGFAVFSGTGGQADSVRILAEDLGLRDRVRFLGKVSKDDLVALYAHAAAVCFPAFDEDLGFITLEAMLSSKPVITCRDSGGSLEFVVDGETGYVVEPEPGSLAEAIARIFARPAEAARMGRAGRERYGRIIPTWDQAVDRLLA